MTLGTFRNVISQVSKFTKLITLHLMGEPLTHPNLKEILDLSSEFNLKVFFVTNGILLKDPNLLLHPAIQQVSFSLHSFTDNFPDKDPSQYLNRIFQFTELAIKERPKLFINYRLWNLNAKLGKDSRNHLILEAIETHFGIPLKHKITNLKQKNLVVTHYLSLHFDTEFTWPSLELPVLGDLGTCYGLRSHFGVLVDGTVVPCCLDKEGAIPLGNLTEKPLDEILKTDRASTMLHGFRINRLVEDLCQRCQYIDRFKDS